MPSSRTELKAGALAVSPSSASDPRSSSVLLLFEEFVPHEYRAALASQGNKPSRSRLVSIPSLLSPNKHKTNKQAKAATVNGRIGSSNRREAEFERLISGVGSATKVLTLDSAARAKGAQPRTGTPLPGETGGRNISSPLMTTSNASAPALQHPSLSIKGPPPPLPHNSPASQKVSTPTTRRSRFKFPGAGGNRQGMLIPAEYDTVDFETRLASYSDDELNDDAGRPPNSKAKRLSKDDAWVDILVASNSKRMTDQDAELRPNSNSKRGLTVSGGSGGRSDPELASQEVAQALAAVRQLPQTDDEGDGGWDPRRDRPRSADLEDIEPVSAQSTNFKSEEKEEDGDGESTVQFPQKKRLGYFDLHPERLQTDRASFNEAGDSYSADYRESTGNSFTEHPYDTSARSTTYSEDFEPTDDGSLRVVGSDVEAPAFIDVDPATSSRYTHDPTKSTVPSSGDGSSSQGKTAALIEMYRERERQQQAQQQQQAAIPIVAPLAIPPKSRLPVRAASLPQQRDEPSVPVDVDVSDDTSHEDFPITQPMPPFVPSELGRASPQRYVHGAPLHNVLEEEEE